MKKMILQDQNAYADAHKGGAGAAGLSAHVVSALAILGLCYAIMPALIGAGSNLITSANFPFVRSDPTMHEKNASITDLGKPADGKICRPCSGGIKQGSLTHGVEDQQLSRAFRAQYNSSDTSMLSLSRSDQHWRIAEAFNTAQDHKRRDFSMQPAALIVIR